MNEKQKLEKAWNDAAKIYAEARQKYYDFQDKKHAAHAEMIKAKQAYLIFCEKENGSYETMEND